MEILQALVERWERIQYAIAPPTPVEAIRFRMNQDGLKPRDLEPFIGSRSRVSEVLSGRRPLTVGMIRALHEHLGVPLLSMVGKTPPSDDNKPRLSKAATTKLATFGVLKRDEGLPAFLARAFADNAMSAMLRKTRTARTNAKTDPIALEAWCGTVLTKAPVPAARPSRRRALPAFGRQLAALSVAPDGPDRVKAALAEVGVSFVVMEHLPGTYLDGAAMRASNGTVIIAMTLRHDRIDNFWFTLLHEFGHV